MIHLVTGGASGIGAALVDRLRERGDDVVLLVRSEERATEVAERWPGVRTLVADLGGGSFRIGAAVPGSRPNA